MKVKCPNCGRIRSIYYRMGLTPIANCANCAQQGQRRRHLNGLTKCTICKQWKPLNCFGNDSARWDKLSAFCRECNTIRLRDYRKRNRDKINEIARRSYRKHQDRANLRALTNVHFPLGQKCSSPNCNNLGQRHHNDYSNADNITWLCRQHHAELHRV